MIRDFDLVALQIEGESSAAPKFADHSKENRTTLMKCTIQWPRYNIWSIC